ncbi:Cytochrome c-type biogenesis protein DsbD, protein-disulfide reductase (EC [uncultured Gammaproteobacteria bacterium]|nr:Cytochrome c-type biogenesis protein DsbD, protein-disulfide reductase (EC [uncultured Gammaproteobacteria bacterium]
MGIGKFLWFRLIALINPLRVPDDTDFIRHYCWAKRGVSTKKALIMSIVFVLAMSVTYSMAGVLAGYFGENLQVLFQTPWVLMVLVQFLWHWHFQCLAIMRFNCRLACKVKLPTSVTSKKA